jgi:arylsulfatase A-like enzyme
MLAALHLPRHLLAGCALAVLEIGLVLTTARALFLSETELGRYALLALTALPAACALLGLFAEGLLAATARGVERGGRQHLRRLRLGVVALGWPLCALVLWLLTSGRRVRALPGRGLIVAMLALAIAAVLGWAATALARADRRGEHSSQLALGLFALAGTALAVDMHVLARLYPVFHLSLVALSTAASLCAACFVQLPSRSKGTASWPWWVLSAGVLAGAWLNVWQLSFAPNARFAIIRSAPVSGKFLQLVRPRTALDLVARAKPPARKSRELEQRPGIDLRDRDVLLITIDALRADRLRAYGGHGLTPTLDRLAQESVVFLRAYTPTPHTSYALSSLMTGKYMHPLLSLAETSQDQPTLAGLLRRHGYRTAAFYPPAIFFVDGERFDWLRRGQLGFEYVKAMFASAQERVPQLEQYLREVAKGHPVFVWVHLFEPHEPYEPPEEFARGDSPLERYEGEVAAADASVAGLVAAFRKARPTATVIVSADHGEEFGEHGGHHHGTTLFDEQVRVPLLWSSPGQTQPGSVAAPVEIIDLTTTLLSALGIPRDARMRGDDLGSLLRGAPAPADMRAFASIDGARMVTDGRMKLICGDDGCQLFDLVSDPQERRDVSMQDKERAAALRADLVAFVASLPRVEALAMRKGGAWPQALARARLGDVSAAPELLPLLASERIDVRAAAARAAGELKAVQTRNVLLRVRERDPDPEVRAEAAIGALLLGADEALEQVVALLPPSSPETSPLARRAALALSAHGDGSGEAVLLALAHDRAADEPLRVAAIRGLAAVGHARATRELLPLLDEVRLRAEVAGALGRIGDHSAVPALVHALSSERYPESRRAEARALLALAARRAALTSTRRFLGTASSMPDGVGLLLENGALSPASSAGADLRAAARVRRGPWQCEPRGCRPSAGASIELPRHGALQGPQRAVLRALVEGTSRMLRIAGEPHYLNAGTNEISLTLAQPAAPALAVEADQGVWLQAIAIVPVEQDVPAPAPQPWSADDPQTALPKAPD